MLYLCTTRITLSLLFRHRATNSLCLARITRSVATLPHILSPGQSFILIRVSKRSGKLLWPRFGKREHLASILRHRRGLVAE